jgi:hypothetical protein
VNLFSKLRVAPQPGVPPCSAAPPMWHRRRGRHQPTFISAYVSPHVDIEPVARAVTGRFPACR